LKKCKHVECNQAKKFSLPEERYRSILKDFSLAVTQPRIKILKLLMAQTIPLTVDDIYSLMGKDACDMATIYRVLAQFNKVNLVSTIRLTKDLIHYEYKNPLHHHHHILCNLCKKVEVIEECFTVEIERALSLKGYKNLDHKLEFFGTCKNCNIA
jgi:Fur family ferric uptake transcriptional regulator